LEDLYKANINQGYKEKHRALSDTTDLFQVLKKIFEKNNFFSMLKNFLKIGTGIYFFNEKLNEKVEVDN
jgi:hypothetical protein